MVLMWNSTIRLVCNSVTRKLCHRGRFKRTYSTQNINVFCILYIKLKKSALPEKFIANRNENHAFRCEHYDSTHLQLNHWQVPNVLSTQNKPPNVLIIQTFQAHHLVCVCFGCSRPNIKCPRMSWNTHWTWVLNGSIHNVCVCVSACACVCLFVLESISGPTAKLYSFQVRKFAKINGPILTF